MSVFIGKNNSNNSILHITKNTHSISELKSGILSDTIFHNDMKYFNYTLYTVTETLVVTDSSGSYYSIDHTGGGKAYTIKILGVSAECANAIANSYTLNTSNIVIYLDSNYNQVCLDTSNVAFVYYKMPLNKWYVKENNAICYCPVPDYNNTIMPCLYRDINVDIKYICVLNINNSLISGYGTIIKPNENIFTIGNTNLNNIRYVSLGQDIYDSSVKKINSKMSLVDTSLFSGQGSMVLSSTNSQLKINNHILFSSANSLYGIQNIVSTSALLSFRRLLYTNNLMFSGAQNGDLVYMRSHISNNPTYSGEIFKGMFVYQEGLSMSVIYRIDYNVWVQCSGGSIYLYTWCTETITSYVALDYSIFK